jgi:hypothetical protein
VLWLVSHTLGALQDWRAPVDFSTSMVSFERVFESSICEDIVEKRCLALPT